MPELALLQAPFLDGPLRPTATAGIASVGTSLPETVVGNGPIAERLGVTEDWIFSRTGIRERRVAAAGRALHRPGRGGGPRRAAARRRSTRPSSTSWSWPP